jgi:hypothetical protein
MAQGPHMTLLPTAAEQVARARADLRMGVPVVIASGGVGLLVLAAETATAARVGSVVAAGESPVVAITGWRAETLKARAYDGDLARIELPGDGGLATWVAGGGGSRHDDLMRTDERAAVECAGRARQRLHRLALLPREIRAALALRRWPLALDPRCQAFAAEHGLTRIEADAERAEDSWRRSATTSCPSWSARGCRSRCRRRGGCTSSAPRMAPKSTTRSRSAARPRRAGARAAAFRLLHRRPARHRSNAIAARSCARR